MIFIICSGFVKAWVHAASAFLSGKTPNLDVPSFIFALVRAAGAPSPGEKTILDILSFYMSFGACRRRVFSKRNTDLGCFKLAYEVWCVPQALLRGRMTLLQIKSLYISFGACRRRFLLRRRSDFPMCELVRQKQLKSKAGGR